MTDLQIAIRRLQAETAAAKLVLEKLVKAQKDLEKPPQHKWEHGDIFKSAAGTTMVCVHKNQGGLHVFCISWEGCDLNHSEYDTLNILSTAKFLFNIKEKL